jgi:hypothetical protein
MPGY